MKIRYLLLILPLLSGCYNYKELNTLGITTSISIDYGDDNFNVIAEVVNPLKQQDASNANKSSFVIFSSSSPSLQEAFREVVLESPRQLYASQLEIIVLSEEVVNNHLDEVLEYFSRDPETRTEIKVMIARGSDSTQGITIQTLLSEFSSSNILESLEVQGKVLGVTYEVTLNELLNMYLDPYLEVSLPSMMLYGDSEVGDEKENLTTTKPRARVKIGTTSVIKDNKILGYLDMEESKIVNIINGKTKETILRYPYKDGYMVFEPNRIKVSNDVDIKNNIVKINIDGFSKIKEIQANTNAKSKDEVDKINKYFNKMLEEEVTNTFNNIKNEYNTDIFGFRELYYRTNNKYFKEHCNDWYDSVFPNIKVEVTSNIKLYEKGNTLGGVKYEREDK